MKPTSKCSALTSSVITVLLKSKISLNDFSSNLIKSKSSMNHGSKFSKYASFFVLQAFMMMRIECTDMINELFPFKSIFSGHIFLVCTNSKVPYKFDALYPIISCQIFLASSELPFLQIFLVDMLNVIAFQTWPFD